MIIRPTTRKTDQEAQEANVHLYGEKIETTESEMHIGIDRTQDGCNSSTISKRITGARRTSFKLMGAGLHALVSVGREVGKHTHTIYVIPTLIHGRKALILSTTDFKDLEDSYRTSLRYIQHLPMSTAKHISRF